MSDTSESGADPARFQVRPIPLHPFLRLCLSSPFLLLQILGASSILVSLHPLLCLDVSPLPTEREAWRNGERVGGPGFCHYFLLRGRGGLFRLRWSEHTAGRSFCRSEKRSLRNLEPCASLKVGRKVSETSLLPLAGQSFRKGQRLHDAGPVDRDPELGGLRDTKG